MYRKARCKVRDSELPAGGRSGQDGGHAGWSLAAGVERPEHLDCGWWERLEGGVEVAVRLEVPRAPLWLYCDEETQKFIAGVTW